MGAEARCRVTFQGVSATGNARLETGVLQFRGGDVRLSIPFNQMSSVTATDGILIVTYGEGTASFALGPAALKWAQKIQHPPTRLDKIGVKPGWKASVVGVVDEEFVSELASAIPDLLVGRVARGVDAIIFGVVTSTDLKRLPTLKKMVKATGAVWVIRPKGRSEVSEGVVRAAGRAAGLVDVKVVGLSPTHTAEKFVIPVSQRG